MEIRADIIQPSWILVFCKNPGRWWVRLLAWGRYHHVKALAYLPRMRGWLIYDVKFNGTRLMLAHEDDPGTRAFLRDYLDNTDTIAMPHMPMPRRAFPQLGSGRHSLARLAPGPVLARLCRSRRQALSGPDHEQGFSGSNATGSNQAAPSNNQGNLAGSAADSDLTLWRAITGWTC